MSSYLIKLFYMNYKINKYEYQTFELLLNGEDETIEEIALKEIQEFEKINNNLKIEQYNIFKHINGVSLKTKQKNTY